MRWPWAGTELHRCLNESEDVGNEISERFRVGVAFAAAQLWEEYEFREEVSKILAIIAQTPTDRIASAFCQVFWASQEFPNDDHTVSLLKSVADYPRILHVSFVSDLVEILAKLCRFQHVLVLKVAEGIVQRFSHELQDGGSELFLATPNLVNISMTLQRFPETRSAGLALLERFMELGLQDAYSVLSEIDSRPSNGQERKPVVRNRRKRKRE